MQHTRLLVVIGVYDTAGVTVQKMLIGRLLRLDLTMMLPMNVVKVPILVPVIAVVHLLAIMLQMVGNALGRIFIKILTWQ